MKNMSSSEAAGKANPKLGMKLPRWENQFDPLFLHVYFFQPRFRPQFWQNWGPAPPVWSTLWITLIFTWRNSRKFFLQFSSALISVQLQLWTQVTHSSNKIQKNNNASSNLNAYLFKRPKKNHYKKIKPLDNHQSLLSILSHVVRNWNFL
jgi:hypothetical protein